MHSAPAVSFPVGRSRFQAGFLALVLMLGAVACTLWALSADEPGWRQLLAAVLLLSLGANAIHALWQSPRGVLHWDGQHWRFTGITRPGAREAVADHPGELDLALDLQFFMLLKLQPGGERALWLWIDRRFDAVRWVALRRAVYFRVHTEPQVLPSP